MLGVVTGHLVTNTLRLVGLQVTHPGGGSRVLVKGIRRIHADNWEQFYPVGSLVRFWKDHCFGPLKPSPRRPGTLLDRPLVRDAHPHELGVHAHAV